MGTALSILSETQPCRLPHIWGASYSGAVCADTPLLTEWLRVSRCFAVSLDSRSYSRLDAAAAAAKSLGWSELPVSFCWSPFPEPARDGTPNAHGAGSFTNPDVILPDDSPKWVQWRTYWSARLTGWTQAWKRVCGVYGENFLKPYCVIDAEAFAHYAGQVSPVPDVRLEQFDARLRQVYGWVEELAKVFGDSGTYWYGANDTQEIISQSSQNFYSAMWRANGYFRDDWPLGDASCPVLYYGQDVRRNMRRCDYAVRWWMRQAAPFWSPALEWTSSGPVYESNLHRVEGILPYPAGKVRTKPWYLSQQRQLGAYFAELAERGRLRHVITWPGPGTTTCEAEIFAQRFVGVMCQ